MGLNSSANPQKTAVSRLYHAALRHYLKQGPGADLEPARELGRQAVTMGLETLDLARVHEIALVALVLPTYAPNTSSALLGRAGLFFAEALTPIEKTHRGAREANARLEQSVEKLAASVEALHGEIGRRTAVETALRASEQTSLGLLEASRRMAESMRRLSHQLLNAQEEERRRISRELHDVIAQTLAGISIRLATLTAGADPGRREADIASTQQLVTLSIDIVHRFARELRPTMLDDLGLIPALESHLKQFSADTGIQVSLQAFAGVELADGVLRTMLYRVAQEALTNVARHARARQVAVSILAQDGSLCMEITDDGTGFAVDGMASARKNNRLGLLGMRERVEMTGGVFAIDSAPGSRTTIRVTVPMDRCAGSAADPPTPTPSALGRELENR